MIDLKRISKTYFNKNGKKVEALNGVDYNFSEKGLYIITGESGCGKTTLLSIIGGLTKKSSGEMSIFGLQYESITKKDWYKYRTTDIGYVFQDNNLFDEMTVYENLSIPLLLIDKTDIDSRIKIALKSVGLSGIDPSRKIFELSAGQKQRIAFARVLVKEPKVILADEPTGNLDKNNAFSVLNMCQEISRKILVVIVTHDVSLINDLTASILEIRNGNMLYIQKNNNELKTITKVDLFMNDVHIDSAIIDYEELSLYLNKYKDSNTTIKLSFSNSEKNKKRISEVSNNQGLDVRTGEGNGKGEAKGDLPFRIIEKISIDYISKSIFRFIISSVMIMLSFILAFVLGAVFFFNEVGTTTRYLNESEIKYVIPEFNVEYSDRLNVTIEKNIQSGKSLYDSFAFECESIYKVYSNVRIVISNSSFDTSIMYANYTVLEDQAFDYEGMLPAEENEVMVTDYLYKQLYGLGNDFVFPRSFSDVDGEKFVVGVVLTDYSQLNISSDDVKEFYKDNIYNIVFVESISEHIIDLSLLDPYGQSYVSFIPNSKISVLSKSVNLSEIAISSAYADFRDLQIGDILDFPDIHSIEYGNRYLDYLSIYSLFENGFVITNIFDSRENIFVLNDNDYQSIFNEYMENYSADYLIGYKGDGWDFSNYDDLELITFEEPIVQAIKEISNDLSQNNTLFYPLLISSFILVLLSIINIVSAVIHKKRREIAIFQTLGVNNKDIFFVFLIQGVLLGSIGFVVALPVYALVISNMNKTLNKVSEYGFNIFSINWFNVIYIFSLVLFVVSIFSWFMVSRILRRPIQFNLVQ